MNDFLSRLRCLLFYHDSEPVEFLSGLIRIFLPFVIGINVCSVSLMLTGLLATWTSITGTLSSRNLSNLISFTVPTTLFTVDLIKGSNHPWSPAAAMAFIALWCLLRTSFEQNNRAWSKK